MDTQKTEQTPRQNKYKDNHIKTLHDQVMKTNDEEKILKVLKEKIPHTKHN